MVPVAGVALGAPRQRQSEGQRAEQQARLRDLPHQVLFTFRGYLTWCFSLSSPHITSSNYSYYSNSGVSGCALNGEAVASDPAARLTESQCLSCQFCPTCCHVQLCSIVMHCRVAPLLISMAFMQTSTQTDNWT